MMRKSAVIAMVGSIIGRMMWRTSCEKLRTSIRAASSTSPSSASSPASISRKTKGVQCQTSTNITAASATSGLPSQSTAGRPSAESTAFNSPNSRPSTSRPMVPMTIGGITIGNRKMPVSTVRLAAPARFTDSAMAKPSTIWQATTVTAKTRVLRTPAQ
jgi:hypothetical protein